ncbi:VanZ family protein [Clostridium tetani]|uniref:VanZ family protein n=2 Tax=Clostridium tetani TaxID=1513 RepID=A0ABY0EQN9_CLOTA|nr:VanZ family protein [Clostridium tetani]RXI57294.1 VanZ family protein [Clostridium tetani]RXI74349.1 VanZ family protein [Clostridium tetani]
MIGITIDPQALLIYGTVLLLISRSIILYKNKKDGSEICIKQELIIILFGIYILGLIGVTLLPIDIMWNNVNDMYKPDPIVNLVPFAQLGFNKGVSMRIILINVIGNLFLLVPMNIFLNLLFHNKFKKINNVILTGLIISTSIELLQYIEMYFGLVYSRASDITDIILNTLGFIVGHVLFIKNCDALFSD